MAYLFCFFFISLFSNNEHHQVNIDGTMGEHRFILLSKNTIAQNIEDISTTGTEKTLIGSIEINIFNNKDSGKVYMNNFQFDQTNQLFCARNPQKSKSKVAIEVFCNKSTDGTTLPENNPRVITPDSNALLLETDSTTQNQTMILYFYAEDNPNNELSSDSFIANFSFIWKD